MFVVAYSRLGIAGGEAAEPAGGARQGWPGMWDDGTAFTALSLTKPFGADVASDPLPALQTTARGRALTDHRFTASVGRGDGLMSRAYVFRLRPTSGQHTALAACVEAHRELYNAARQERRDGTPDHVFSHHRHMSAELPARVDDPIPTRSGFTGRFTLAVCGSYCTRR